MPPIVKGVPFSHADPWTVIPRVDHIPREESHFYFHWQSGWKSKRCKHNEKSMRTWSILLTRGPSFGWFCFYSQRGISIHIKSLQSKGKKTRIHNIECYEIELQGESLLVVSIFPQVMNQSASLTNVWKSMSSSSWYGKSWLPSPNSDFKLSLERWGQGTPRWFGCGDGTGRWSGYGQLSQLFLMFNFPLTTAYSNLDVHTFL